MKQQVREGRTSAEPGRPRTSMQYSEYSCTRCDFVADGINYWSRFSCQCQCALIPIKREAGWCSRCSSVQAIEVLPSENQIEMLRREIANVSFASSARNPSLNSERSWFVRIKHSIASMLDSGRLVNIESAVIESDLKEELGRHKVLRRRNSPPRCLQCGSIEIFRIIVNQESQESEPGCGFTTNTEFHHPGCGGWIIRRDTGTKVRRIPAHRIYDIEGNFLYEQERP